MKFKLKSWKNLKVDDKILVSSIDSGISSYLVIKEIESSDLVSIYLFLSLTDNSEKIIMDNNENIINCLSI